MQHDRFWTVFSERLRLRAVYRTIRKTGGKDRERNVHGSNVSNEGLLYGQDAGL